MQAECPTELRCSWLHRSANPAMMAEFASPEAGRPTGPPLHYSHLALGRKGCTRRSPVFLPNFVQNNGMHRR